MNREQSKKNKYFEEEITFRELILKIREYLFDWVKNWKWIALTAGIFMLIIGTKAILTPTEYKARLSFMINQDNGNPLGSISGVLGSFGISTKGKNNLAKVLELARSRKIIEKSIFQKVKINDQDDLLVNHFITHLDTTGQWNKLPWYQINKKVVDSLPYRFENLPKEDDSLSEVQQMALKKIVRKIGGNPETEATGMMETHYDESSQILYLSVKTKDPDLSIQLTNTLFDELSDFYIRKTVEKQQATYDIVKAKTDSIQFLLEQKEQQLAALEDTWMGRYSSKSKLKEQRLEKEIRILNITLAESIKNKEIADFAVRNTMPYVQIIDRPEVPLDGQKPSWLKHAVIGFFLGLLISLSLLFLRKIYLDAIKY